MKPHMKTDNCMKALVDELNHRMMIKFDFANMGRNRALKLASNQEVTLTQLRWLFNEYLALPRIIVELLSAVRDSAGVDNMVAIRDELTRNLGEELGSDTHGVSHYELLIRGANHELGHQVSNKVSPCTQWFCHQMKRMAYAMPTSTAVGVAYALESSARPELLVVRKLVDVLAGAAGRSLKPNGILADFFDRHINVWEVGHECHLREACEACLTEADHADFERGFMAVMQAMERWWEQLAAGAATL